VKRAEKAERILEVLDELYPDPEIPLAHEDPFTLLVAVLLSAQTTDARVNLVTPALFRRAPTPERMARLSLREIHALIRTCGLAPQKSKNLKALARRVVERHGGRVPDTFEELEALPGVGHKTASVVLVQAFGRPAFPVDTHIHRLAARWGLSDGTSVERTERDLKALFPERAWGRMHLKIILFGREHCPARGHDLEHCPICSWAASARRKALERRGGGSRAASAGSNGRAAAARERPAKTRPRAKARSKTKARPR
jgi:endonuclease III